MFISSEQQKPQEEGNAMGGSPSRLVKLVAVVAVILVAVVTAGWVSTTAAQRQVLFTEWEVIDMEGFAENASLNGEFDFTLDRFRYYDGVNHSSSKIKWTADGFEVESRGSTTGVAVAEGGPTGELGRIAEPGLIVTIDTDRETMTLTSGTMVVKAVRR